MLNNHFFIKKVKKNGSIVKFALLEAIYISEEMFF